MQWLYRAISDQSQGTHRPDLIAPGAAAGQTKYELVVATEDLKQIIQDALAWKKTSGNEISFWTSSLLFAIQAALYKAQKSAPETNVRILCVNTKTSRGMDGSTARFEYMPKLKREHGIDLRNKDGSDREHNEVWVTMECLVPGADAVVAMLEDLESSGLYELYPALKGSSISHRPRLNLVVQDVRKFHFKAQQGLTNGHLTVASKVAASFKSFGGMAAVNVPTQILIPLLAMQKRPQNDPALLEWLQQNAFAASDRNVYGSAEGEEGTLPEIAEANRLAVLFQGKKVSPRVLTATSSITAAAVRGNWQSWVAWRNENKEARRTARDGGDRYEEREHGSAGHKKRRQSSEEGRASPDDRYPARKSRDWLPRASYELRLAQQRDQEKIGGSYGNSVRKRKRLGAETEGEESASGPHREGGFRATRPRRHYSERRPRRF